MKCHFAIRQALAVVLSAGLALTSSMVPGQARDLCPPGMVLSSTSFSCVTAGSSTQGGYTNGQKAVIALGAAAAIFAAGEALSKNKPSTRTRPAKQYQTPKVIEKPLSAAAQKKKAQIESVNALAVTCAKQSKKIQRETGCFKQVSDLYRALDQLGSADIYEFAHYRLGEAIGIDPGCNDIYPAFGQGDMCTPRDATKNGLYIKNPSTGLPTCCVVAEGGGRLPSANGQTSFRKRLLKKKK